MKNFQVAIIGGGVIGSAIAWELAKYKLRVVVFEKGSDVASGSSKANSGVIHSGINSEPGSLKARFCVKGNKEFQNLSDKLGFSLKWVGKYVIAKNEEEIKKLEKLKNAGIQNNVPGLEIHEKSRIIKKEKNVNCVAGLWVPTAGIILPYEFTICLAENAAINGVKFFLETEVIGLIRKNDGFIIKTNKGSFQSDIVVNASGLNCKKIALMIEKPHFDIYPCRGEYLVLDKNYSDLIESMIYPLPEQVFGILGVHITPTIEGNILLGPSSEFIDNNEDTITTKDMMKNLYMEAKEIIPKIPRYGIISAYSGIRCKLTSKKEKRIADYVIEVSEKTSGLINLIGIESPGLTASPAIAKEVVKIISKSKDLFRKKNFKFNKKSKRFSELNFKEKNHLINLDERYGRIICRCENITEAEVIKALSNPLKAQTLASVKYRCRAGMGRCQGGFCTQHIVRILEKEFNKNIKDIKLKSPQSYLFTRRNRKGCR